MSKQLHIFIVLEGLSGVGKSVVAERLAARLGLEFVETIVPEFTEARSLVDRSDSVLARFHFYFAANYVVGEQIAGILQKHGVVLESYFYRTIATHRAMANLALPSPDWNMTVSPDYCVQLTADEDVRRQRLKDRDGTMEKSKWHALVEENISLAIDSYDSFGLPRLDTTNKTVDEVVDAVENELRARHLIE